MKHCKYPGCLESPAGEDGLCLGHQIADLRTQLAKAQEESAQLRKELATTKSQLDRALEDPDRAFPDLGWGLLLQREMEQMHVSHLGKEIKDAKA